MTKAKQELQNRITLKYMEIENFYIPKNIVFLRFSNIYLLSLCNFWHYQTRTLLKIGRIQVSLKLLLTKLPKVPWPQSLVVC